MPAKLVQRRRGTTTNHSVFVGAEGEITQDTTKNTLVCHDGNTQGGHPLAKEDMSNVIGTASGGGVGITQLNLSDGSDGQVLTTDGSGNISFRSIDVNTDLSLGGDLTGSISDAQIITNAVGINELNVDPPVNGGQLLSADSSGNLEFISPTNNMDISGDVSGPLSNAQIVSQAVGTPELATGAVTTIKIADLNVTSDKIADGSITSNKIAGLSVTTDKITDGNITLAKMADNSIRTGNIIDGNITSSKIAALSIDGTKIANNAVDGTKIATGAVDGTKIANNAVGITQLNVSDGNAGEFLQTNGAGVLSFATAASTLTGTSFQGISVFRALKETPQYDGPDNVEQTYTIPAGVQSILYIITAGGNSGSSSGPSATDGQSGATIWGHLDVSNITSLQLRVGTGGRVVTSVSNLPQTGQGYSSYLGDIVPGVGDGDGGAVGTTDDTTATGSIATARQGTNAIGGDLLLSGRAGPGNHSFWPGIGEGGAKGIASTSDSGVSSRPGDVGQPGIIVILEFG